MKLALITLGQCAELVLALYFYLFLFKPRSPGGEFLERVYKIFKLTALLAVGLFGLYVVLYLAIKLSLNVNLPVYEDLYYGLVFNCYLFLFGLAYIFISNAIVSQNKVDD